MGTVYFVNGFLEAGKTTFIKELISRESFRISGKTLILLCEEGDLEYDDEELAGANAFLEIIEEEANFNEDTIAALEKKHEPERIIVEFNGMWDRKNLEFPWYWDDIMEIILDPDEHLPYDINADELFFDDEGFAVLSLDSLQRCEVYDGKKVHFNACVYKMKDGSDLEFIAGRIIITCCEADMSFVGFICGYPKGYELDDREWVEISGILRIRFDDEMQRNIPVCRVTDLKEIDKPDKEIISLI